MHRDELIRIIGEERRKAAARWRTLAQARTTPGPLARFTGFLHRMKRRTSEAGSLPRFRPGEFRTH